MDNYGITHLTDGAKTNNDRVKSNGGLIKHPIFQLYRAYLFIGILNSTLINSNLGLSIISREKMNLNCLKKCKNEIKLSFENNCVLIICNTQ